MKIKINKGELSESLADVSAGCGFDRFQRENLPETITLDLPDEQEEKWECTGNCGYEDWINCKKCNPKGINRGEEKSPELPEELKDSQKHYCESDDCDVCENRKAINKLIKAVEYLLKAHK